MAHRNHHFILVSLLTLSTLSTGCFEDEDTILVVENPTTSEVPEPTDSDSDGSSSSTSTTGDDSTTSTGTTGEVSTTGMEPPDPPLPPQAGERCNPMMPFRGEPSCDDGLACTAFGFDVELQAVTFRCVRFTYNPLTTGGRDGTPCNWWSQQDNAACLDNYECVPAEVLPPNFIPGGSGACTQMCSNNFDCPEGRRCDFHYKRIDNDPLLYAEGDFGRCIL